MPSWAWAQKREYRLFWGIISWFGNQTVYKKFIFSFMTKEIIFPFSIIRIMHPTSNISSKMFYSAFEAEIPQTACTTSKCETFCKASEILIIRLNRQGGDINVFTSTWAIIYGRHFLTFRKFDNSSEELFDSSVK